MIFTMALANADAPSHDTRNSVWPVMAPDETFVPEAVVENAAPFLVTDTAPHKVVAHVTFTEPPLATRSGETEMVAVGIVISTLVESVSTPPGPVQEIE